MAIQKYRLCRGDDIIHLESSSDLILRPDSTTVESALTGLRTDVNGKAASNHTHSNYVPTTRTINSKALSANISLTATDVGAAATSHTHSAYVPTTRTVNGKALNANISLTASDVGAAASSHTHSTYVPTTRTVNGKALSANITLSASDVGAASSSHSHSQYLTESSSVIQTLTGKQSNVIYIPTIFSIATTTASSITRTYNAPNLARIIVMSFKISETSKTTVFISDLLPNASVGVGSLIDYVGNLTYDGTNIQLTLTKESENSSCSIYGSGHTLRATSSSGTSFSREVSLILFGCYD
ncbi:MAG: hypothetical protein NC114_06645 [Ruminococcus flavefaciens]|nr:hypothetical protein [Ruminococcus flavefaciens]